MLILALKPGHDGTVAVVQDSELLFSIEAEKNSFVRYSSLTPTTILRVAERIERIPDVVAIGGWHRRDLRDDRAVEAGYYGSSELRHERKTLFGHPVRLFTSTHERSHVMMAAGMAPDEGQQFESVLVWEGGIGSFYVLDRQARIVKTIPVLAEPGSRYAFLYGLADAHFPDAGAFPNIEDSGKLMALSSFASASDADEAVRDTVDRIMQLPALHPAPKSAFRTSPVYNAGVEADCTKAAGALLTQRLFDTFLQAAERCLPRDLPLRISGGCGLNCHWNALWRRCGYFSSVFVPPCTNDSGSAIGTAIDALMTISGQHRISWTVYAGFEFDVDIEPAAAQWVKQPLDHDELAVAIGRGEVVAWVQGRWEMGPRALGHRSLLAEPFRAETRHRLNRIKQREPYRPIAPCCRLEDVQRLFEDSFEDPHMLYARRVLSDRLRAVTHVDGTARLQTVTPLSDSPLYQLLSAFARRYGDGVLCNTSLNDKGLGFINRMSDLAGFCETRGVEHMVVGDAWFRHVR